MKAIYLIRHGVANTAFQIREEKDPLPTESEVLIDVEVSGLNFADVLARRGLYPDAPKISCVLGYEVVGRVVSVGHEIKKLSAGDRVLAFTRFGGYASKVVANPMAVVKISEEMDAGVAAAMATQYCTAWFAAEEMVRLFPGDRVLIQAAAGGVGTALVQIAKRRGCVVFGTAGSSAKLDYLKTIGVDHPINYRQQDFSGEVRTICGDQGLDVVFDSIGGKTFRQGYNLLTSGGRIVTFGVAGMTGSRWDFLRVLRTVLGFGFFHGLQLISNSKSVIGVNMLRIAEDKPDVLQRCMRTVVDLAEKGELSPKVGGEYPADRVADAHAFLENRQSTGKVVLRWKE
ncbi:MAG: zinc-binding dehydrogenase [Nitrospinae bacterium]|jgi:NADPH:quinone reductase-like Zn-dependent oxidoreductase|nr:zinc-binding dehydrogenase [Nitrospinota bacterium]MDA1110827.1 zinc-binding dehydrogenase [Nitrospinota bacterium]